MRRGLDVTEARHGVGPPASRRHEAAAAPACCCPGSKLPPLWLHGSGLHREKALPGSSTSPGRFHVFTRSYLERSQRAKLTSNPGTVLMALCSLVARPRDAISASSPVGAAHISCVSCKVCSRNLQLQEGEQQLGLFDVQQAASVN